MIASYIRGRRKCRTPAATNVTPRRARGIRVMLRGSACDEQPRVAVRARAGEVLRAAALRVQIGELARDAGEALAVVVDHPRLKRDPGARLAQPEHARLLGKVGERGGAEKPVAAAGADAVLVRVACDGGDDARGAVEH